jgi:hypothetical protein
MTQTRKRAPYRQRRASEVDKVAVLLYIEALKEGGYSRDQPRCPRLGGGGPQRDGSRRDRPGADAQDR